MDAPIVRAGGAKRRSRLGVLGAALLLAGCAAAPKSAPATNPAESFDDRVLAAQSLLETKGESPTDAKVDATQQVTREVAAAERLQHLAEVKPLARALEQLERARGAWKYTATTTTTAGGATSMRVETFDPSQPDATLWTLEQVDGKAPSPSEQDAYRRLKLAQWRRRQAEQPPRPESVELAHRAVFDFFTITPSADGKTREFAFVSAPAKVGPKFSTGQFRDAFTYDPAAHRLLRRERVLLYRVGVVGGIAVDAFAASADFGEFGQGRLAFVAKTTTRLRLHAHGVDQGERTVEVVYSGYHAVKPYAPRALRDADLPSLADSIPGGL